MAKDPYRYFRVEAREILERLGKEILALEKEGAAKERVRELLRLAHTLKGAARVIKQPAIADLAHAMEEALAPYREGTGALPGDRIDELLKLTDAVAGLVTGLDPAGAPPAPTDGAARSPGGVPAPTGTSTHDPAPTDGAAPAAGASIRDPGAGPGPTGGRAEARGAATARSGTSARDPGVAPAPTGGAAQASVPSPGPTTPPAPVDDRLESVRVEVGEMDALLERAREAEIQFAALRPEARALAELRRRAAMLAEQLARRGTQTNGAALAAAGRALELAEELAGALDRVQRGLGAALERTEGELVQVREAAERLRLLPAGAGFAALERTARDIARELGRAVEFRASGGEHRLDTHVLADLRGALLQVVRNAVAHGIEPPADRLAAGKPAAGRIDLSVERRGNRLAFVCRDDGRGIDVEAVRSAAVRKGQLGAAAAAALGTEDLFALLLRGGVSTTGAVSAVSGRGIGMDIVRAAADRLKGEVGIRSVAGAGTTVELCVPVSLSSLPALLAEAGGVPACIPLDAVRGVVRLAPGDVARSADAASVVHDGAVLPLVSLARVLRRPDSEASASRSRSAVIVAAGDGAVALGVERLHGVAGVTVRALPAWVPADAAVAGGALDADGTPRLVLDPAALVAAGRERHPVATHAPAPPPPVLVVDDSLTTRMLEQSILESAGYAVDLAVSGEEALRKARERRYGLFVVDVEMPGMDGFEFIVHTRAEPVLRDVPAILVTSRSSPEDRRRGQEAGASAYIVKSEFDQNRLLHLIRTLMG